MQKALRGLEVGVSGFDSVIDLESPDEVSKLSEALSEPGADRIWYLADAFRSGMSFDEIQRLTAIDPWFLVQIEELIEIEKWISSVDLNAVDEALMRRLKRKGFSDARMANLLGLSEKEVREYRRALGITPVYKLSLIHI